MANVLPFDKQVTVIASLAEGASIRGIERMTGVNRNTIMSLGLRVGNACAKMMDAKMRGLNCQRLEVDELWAFIQKKQAQCVPGDFKRGFGDVYTFVALDSDTKLIPAYLVGKRDAIHAIRFFEDLAPRLTCKVQLSTDAFSGYANAIDNAFGSEIHFGQCVKIYSSPLLVEQKQSKYSPGKVIDVERTVMVGEPEESKISTSYIEKQNHTVRMHCRRLSRLTNAFSKKLDSFKAAVSLHFAYYNFVRRHSTVRMTPAMAAGVERSALTVADLVDLAR